MAMVTGLVQPTTARVTAQRHPSTPLVACTFAVTVFSLAHPAAAYSPSQPTLGIAYVLLSIGLGIAMLVCSLVYGIAGLVVARQPEYPNKADCLCWTPNGRDACCDIQVSNLTLGIVNLIFVIFAVATLNPIGAFLPLVCTVLNLSALHVLRTKVRRWRNEQSHGAVQMAPVYQPPMHSGNAYTGAPTPYSPGNPTQQPSHGTNQPDVVIGHPVHHPLT